MRNRIRDRDPAGGFTLIELLVVLAVIGTLLALLLPAIQAAREAARRAQCFSNLRQVALASLNYEGVMGVLPMGAQVSWTRVDTGLDSGQAGITTSGSIFIALLPYLESQSLYNTVNFDVNIRDSPNSTVHGVGISVLHCPSDPMVGRPWTVPDGGRAAADGGMFGPGPVVIQSTSYAGNSGTSPQPEGEPAAKDGVFWPGSAVGMSQITDGTSHTFLFAERAQGLLPGGIAPLRQWWASGLSEDTRFSTLYPMNPHLKIKYYAESNATSSIPPILSSASSFHSGGCNFAHADGSVHFIKELVDTRPYDRDTGEPGDNLHGHDGFASFRGDIRRLSDNQYARVYQALSTRAGSEVITPDDYQAK